MSASYQIQKPYVVAELPRPFQQPSTDAYVVGEVYGYHSSHGRRKRPELVIGINGEAANIYDISSSRLITSYPIPPQQSFSCPPISLRIRLANGQGIARYTYIATTDTANQHVTIFKDVVDASGKTSSTSKTHRLKSTSPIRYVGSSPKLMSSASPDGSGLEGNVGVVCADGEVFSLDPETLGLSWQESASRLSRDEVSTPASKYNVEFVGMASATEVIEGLFDGRSDSLNAAFPQHLNIEEENPDCILLVSDIERNGSRERQFSVLGLLPTTGATSTALRRMVQLHVANIPSVNGADAASTGDYKLHLQSGTLLELRNQHLVVYDLTAAVPVVQHRLYMQGATSFLRLSGHSILAGSPSALNIYNPTFHSLQTTVPLDLSGAHSMTSNGQENAVYTLITYFRRLDIAVGLLDNMLVGVQIDPPRAGGKRSRGEGLLIDSIGKGTPRDFTTSRCEKEIRKAKSAVLALALPGSTSHDYLLSCLSDMDRADEFLLENDLQSFEDLLAKQFRVARGDVQPNGMETSGTGDGNLPEWSWLPTAADYPRVDRRWVQYAISRVFDLHSQSTDPSQAVSLALGSSNVVIYLVVAGHLTLANVRSAFRGAQQGPELSDVVLAEGLVRRLVDIDPAMHLLLNYISSTKLGPVELLIVVRTIMRSLDYIQENSQPAPKLLMQEAHHNGDEGDEGDDDLMELDELERQLQATEQHIADEDDPRPSGLMVALAKLGSQSAQATVKAFRSCFKAEEILSLIFVLRGELVHGSWTSKYVGMTNAMATDSEAEAPPDESIALLANLLSRCVDSIGPGGWLLNDSIRLRDHADAGDLLSALKLEVSAALEGVEEAVQLEGVLVEVVRYAEHKADERRKAEQLAKKKTLKLQPVEAGAVYDSLLPIGLVPRPAVSSEKVRRGGEVTSRSKREMGYLTGQAAVERVENQGPAVYLRSNITL